MLTLALTFMLILSHGSIGDAAPHHQHSDRHEHADASGKTDSAQHGDPDALAPIPGNPDEGSAGHLTHVHVLADLVRADNAPLSVDVRRPAIRIAHIAPPLPSHGTAPLLEPPSA